MLTASDIERIVGRIVAGYAPERVGIFGSYALGTATDASDLDVFVIKRTRESQEDRKRAVRRLLFGVVVPVDVAVFTPEEFADEQREEYSFGWIVARQARLLYSTP